MEKVVVGSKTCRKRGESAGGNEKKREGQRERALAK